MIFLHLMVLFVRSMKSKSSRTYTVCPTIQDDSALFSVSRREKLQRWEIRILVREFMCSLKVHDGVKQYTSITKYTSGGLMTTPSIRTTKSAVLKAVDFITAALALRSHLRPLVNSFWGLGGMRERWPLTGAIIGGIGVTDQGRRKEPRLIAVKPLAPADSEESSTAHDLHLFSVHPG